MAPNCLLCPKNNDNFLNTWCSDECYFDDDDATCKEKGNTLVNIILK